MAYMEQLQSGLKYLTAAGETGRRSLDGMLGPVNGAIGEISGAASELSDLPFIGPAVGAKVQRLMRGVNAAQAKVGAVVATYNKATRAASQIEERLGVLKEQSGKAATAINKIAGKVSPSLANIVPTGALGADAAPAAEAVKPFPHLLIMQPLKPGSTPFYFNLDTAAFDELKRSSEYRWASQERLSRRPAQQAGRHGRRTHHPDGRDFWRVQRRHQTTRHPAQHRRPAPTAGPDHRLWRGAGQLVFEKHRRRTKRPAARRHPA